ncbi:MAG: hypothetical protein R6X32_09235 [Chloroflexota bacterium]|jgi:heme exporter protein D
MISLLTGAMFLLQAMPAEANRFNDYLVLAYGIMWLIGMVYVISLVVRQRNLLQDIRLMQQVLEDEQDEASSK